MRPWLAGFDMDDPSNANGTGTLCAARLARAVKAAPSSDRKPHVVDRFSRFCLGCQPKTSIDSGNHAVFASAGGQEWRMPVNHAQVLVTLRVAAQRERKMVKSAVNLRANRPTLRIQIFSVPPERKRARPLGERPSPRGFWPVARRGAGIAARGRGPLCVRQGWAGVNFSSLLVPLGIDLSVNEQPCFSEPSARAE